MKMDFDSGNEEDGMAIENTTNVNKMLKAKVRRTKEDKLQRYGLFLICFLRMQKGLKK